MAERHEPDAHLLYVGYPGTMAWEFQFENCSAGRPPTSGAALQEPG